MLTRSFFAGPGLDRRDLDPMGPQGEALQLFSAVLFKADAEDGPFLIQRRRTDADVDYAGRLSLFGGRRLGEETPEACAVREVSEETTLRLSPADLQLIGRLESENEGGQMTFGHIYLVEGLPFDRLASLDIQDGEGVFIRPCDVGARIEELTPIAIFALSIVQSPRRSALATRSSHRSNGLLRRSRR